MNATRLAKTIVAIILICSLGSKGEVLITSPVDGDTANFQTRIEGTSSAIAGSGIHVYILVWPEDESGSCQIYEADTDDDGEWTKKVTLGEDRPSNSGRKYIVMVIESWMNLNEINCTTGQSEIDHFEINLTRDW